MPRKIYPNTPFPEDMFNNEDESPVIDPGPAINFDAMKHAAANAAAETAAKPETAPKNAKESVPARDASEIPASASEECPQCAEANKARLLALAELENARKRMAREKEEFSKFAGESVIADILPAIDNLDLALAYAPEGKECQNFVVGVDMTRKLLLDALSRHGLEQVGALGEPFDPAKHEAMGMEPNAEYEDGQVCGLMSKGYKLKDRLIRPAKVTVCKKD
ncbi:MAG: Protein GrpE [Desulfovibrio sp.]